MRVVLDTNAFISSFLGTQSPRRIIELWKEDRIILCLSREIVDEYVEVLERLGFESGTEVEEILQLFARSFHSLFIAKTPDLKIVENDPDDNKFFECAVALKAEIIIAGDKAVLGVKKYAGIDVLSPKEFVEIQ